MCTSIMLFINRKDIFCRTCEQRWCNVWERGHLCRCEWRWYLQMSAAISTSLCLKYVWIILHCAFLLFIMKPQNSPRKLELLRSQFCFYGCIYRRIFTLTLCYIVCNHHTEDNLRHLKPHPVWNKHQKNTEYKLFKPVG